MSQIHQWQTTVENSAMSEQGIARNDAYLYYYELARLEFSNFIGIDFNEFQKLGYYFVVTHVEVDFLASLKLGDKIYVESQFESYDDRRMYFTHQIKFCDGDKVASTCIAQTACVSVKTDSSCMPEVLRKILDKINTA